MIIILFCSILCSCTETLTKMLTRRYVHFLGADCLTVTLTLTPSLNSNPCHFEPEISTLRHSVEHYYCAKFQVVWFGFSLYTPRHTAPFQTHRNIDTA